MKLEEVIVGVLIVLVIGLTLLPETEKIITEPVTEISFEAYPLKAWRDGRVVKIKYRVDEPNRRLWIYNKDTGELVHKQPYDRDPNDDGTSRTFTYLWKTYKTERTIDLPEGTYEIVLGGQNKGGFGQISVIYYHI